VVRYLIQHGVAKDRLTAVGYGESRPKIITKKLAETLLAGEPKVEVQVNDTLTENYILRVKDKDEQEVLNALNRRTEFRVLRTTYGTTLNEYKPEEEERKAAAKRKEEAAEEENFIF
jgi:outer membrane protein OmpA-like peptidoglycan-associated protein